MAGWITVLMVSTWGWLVPVVAYAQPVKEAIGVDFDDDEELELNLAEQKPGFQIPLKEEVVTSFGDFERYLGRKDWARAFRVLEDVPPDERSGMLEAAGGYYIPARDRFWQSIVTMPAEGRAAFRVFYDPKAEQLLKEAKALQHQDQLAAIDKLRTIYQDYFLTSSGDKAADLLGDIHFERGEFIEARDYWKAIADHYPESDVTEGQLLFKQGLATLLAGRKKDAEKIASQLERRFASESVLLGGESVVPGEYLRNAIDRWGTDGPRDEARVAEFASREGVSNPPEETTPVWQMQFLSPKGRVLMRQAVAENSWNTGGIESYVPPFVIDQERLYVNWFGICFATDLTTGKLLWRSDKFSVVHDKFSNLHSQNVTLSQFSLTLDDGILLAVRISKEQLENWQAPFWLTAYDPTTGKQLWTHGSQGNGDTSIIGRPVISDDAIYVLTHGQQEQEVTLLALDPTSGRSLWKKKIGSVQMLVDSNYNERYPVPEMLLRGDSLFILTNNGALAEFDLVQREILSLLRYEGAKTANSNSERQYWGNAVADETVTLHTPGSLLQRDGLIYCKESGSRVLFALDPTHHKVVWNRPLDKSAAIVGIEDETVYVMSRELMAINRDTRALKWSVALPITGGGFGVVPAEKGILVCTTRGIFEVSRENGDILHIFRGADLDSIGGSLTRVGDRLINISNQSITAYPLSP